MKYTGKENKALNYGVIENIAPSGVKIATSLKEKVELIKLTLSRLNKALMMMMTILMSIMIL